MSDDITPEQAAAYAAQYLQELEARRAKVEFPRKRKHADLERLYNQRGQIRRYLRAGLIGTATAYAKKKGLDIEPFKVELGLGFTATLPPPAPAAMVTAPQPEPAHPHDPNEAPPATAMVNGWPAESRATIWAPCRNKRQVLIHLEDGREATMWTTGRTWRLGTRLRVTLDSDQAQGDPRYLAIEGSVE